MSVFSKKNIDFDGSNDHAIIGDVSPFKFDVGDAFSVSGWIKTTDASGIIVAKLQGAGDFDGWEVGITTGGKLYIQIIDDNGVPQNCRVDTPAEFPYNQNRWHHFVVTKNTTELASGITWYTNGTVRTANVINDTFVSNGGTSFDTTAPLCIGIRDGTAAPFDGNMDDIAIYNKELSAAEVAAIYGQGQPQDLRLIGPTCNLIGYWAMGDGDTFPTLRDRQNTIPILAAGSVQDRSQNSNDGTPTNMEDGDFRDVILAAEGMPDWSGNGNLGTPTNMEDSDFVTDTPGGISCYSALLDGTNEYILIGDVTALKFVHTDDFSVSLWIKTTTAVASSALFSKRDLAGTGTGFECLINSSAGILRPRFEIEDNLGNIVLKSPTAGADLDDDAWHHVVYTWNGSAGLGNANAEIYVDGTLSVAIGSGALVSTIDNTADAQIGATDGTTRPFDGRMDDVTVYNSALSLTEVQEVYNSGFPADNRTLTTQPSIVGYWGMGEFTMGGISKFASEFDGVNEYITMGNVLNQLRTDTFSIAGWFKTTATVGYLCSKIDGGLGRGYGIALEPTGKIQFLLTNTFTTTWDLVETNAAFNDGTWKHCAVTSAGTGTGAMFIYINGALAASTIIDSLLGSNPITNTGPFNFGSRSDGSITLDGSMDNWTVYDKVLSLAEIQAIYNNASPTDNTLLDTEPNLVGYWLMGPDANDGTMTNMVSGDIVTPGANECTVINTLISLGDAIDGDVFTNDSLPTGVGQNPHLKPIEVGSGGDVIITLPGATFVMRGIDLAGPYPSYHVWTVPDMPDDDGSEAGVLPFGGPLDEITVIGIIS